MSKEGIWIKPLSDYQVGFLRNLFINEDSPAKIMVNKIALADNGAMVVEYVHYGQLTTKMIEITDTKEKAAEKENYLTFKTNVNE